MQRWWESFPPLLAGLDGASMPEGSANDLAVAGGGECHEAALPLTDHVPRGSKIP